ILIYNSYLYLSGGGGIRILDVSDPTSPTLKGIYPSPQSSMLARQGNLLFAVRSGQPGELRILKLDDPTSPTTVSVYPMSFVGGIAVDGSWLYVAGGTDNNIHVLDISDPTSPTQRAVFTHPDMHFPTSLNLKDGKLYFISSGGPKSFGILDVTDPLNPTLLSFVTDTSISEGGLVRVFGDFAYLLDTWGAGIIIYDVSDPQHPQNVFWGDTGLGTWAHGLIVDGLNLYAYGDHGVRIFNYTVPVVLSSFSLD
ncbi:MAG: hypothetical protein AAB817_02115, partial [Patescibacteria group bacterium]